MKRFLSALTLSIAAFSALGNINAEFSAALSTAGEAYVVDDGISTYLELVVGVTDTSEFKYYTFFSPDSMLEKYGGYLNKLSYKQGDYAAEKLGGISVCDTLSIWTSHYDEASYIESTFLKYAPSSPSLPPPAAEQLTLELSGGSHLKDPNRTRHSVEGDISVTMPNAPERHEYNPYNPRIFGISVYKILLVFFITLFCWLYRKRLR